MTLELEQQLVDRGLTLTHRIYRNGAQVGVICRSKDWHYDTIALPGETFSLPEWEPLFGLYIGVIVGRLQRIGCEVNEVLSQ
jgi:hypothetical protein